MAAEWRLRNERRIADAANLSWLLAAVLNGWATPAILDAYEAERRPITEQVSQFAKDMASKNIEHRRETPSEIELPGLVAMPCARASARKPTTQPSINLLRGAELRLFLRSFADHRIRWPPAASIHHARLYALIGPGLPGTSYMAGVGSFAL